MIYCHRLLWYSPVHQQKCFKTQKDPRINQIWKPGISEICKCVCFLSRMYPIKTLIWMHYSFVFNNTGHFIMFSLITNIYNKKTKGPTLMGLSTAIGKMKKFFLTTRDVRCLHHGWHSTHRYDIQVVATHMSTCWRVCGNNLNIVSMCAVSPVVHASNISSCQNNLFQFSCGCEQFH